jgi:hypothetical protein
MVVVIHGTDGIVAPGLTSEDSTGTSTLTTSTMTVSDSAQVSGLLNVAQSLVASGLTYPSADGSDNKVVTTDGSGNLSLRAFGSLVPVVVSTNTNAVAGKAYFLNGAGLNITLPASPDSGDIIGISEVVGDDTSTILRNGSKIMGNDSDLTLDVAYVQSTLTYTGDTVGWALT